MTPPRDGGPVEGNEFVAPVIPLRRTEGGVDTAVVEPEPQVDLFDRADDPESGLDPLEVFVAPLAGLRALRILDLESTLVADVRPLAGLTDAAVAIAGGRLDTRVDAGDDADLEELASAFNQMTANLQDRIEREARFTSDVSHALR